MAFLVLQITLQLMLVESTDRFLKVAVGGWITKVQFLAFVITEHPRKYVILVGVVEATSAVFVKKHEILEVAELTSHPFLRVFAFLKGTLAIID